MALPFAAVPVLADSDFAGTDACQYCHQDQYRAWKGSHHDLAMQEATQDTVLGDFQDASLTARGLTSRFFRRSEDFIVNTDGPDGQPADFVVRYTFGVHPLQQYLVEFPDGRIQALGLAWDSRTAEAGGQRWFHLFPDEPVKAGDPFHWTGVQQNWNYMCADCHVTGFEKNYDPAADRFQSRWSEIDVACEACHGPGRRHVELARGGKLTGQDVESGLTVLLHDRKGAHWNMDVASGIARRSQPLKGGTEVEVCAACHSRRGTIHPGTDGQVPFLDYHLPAFLTEPLYYADGQIRDEVYVWGSFLQSRMYAAGVTCSDCHDPHSSRLKAPGDQVCAQCHAPTRFASPEHHGHPQGSAGSDCLACHMPETTYMQVDPRRDHSLRSPRPNLSAELGMPNACNTCHADQSAAWAAEAFARQFPNAGTPFQSWAGGFHQAREGLPQAEVSLLGILQRPETPDLVRATAIQELGRFLSPLSADALKSGLGDPSPLVRIGALRALETLPAENRYKVAEHLLGDPVRGVRAEAGRVLAATPREYLQPVQQQVLDQAVQDYVKTQDFNADRPESRVNLGNLYVRMGQPEKSEAYYHEAIRRDRTFTPAYLYLAELYRNQGLNDEARSTLQAGLNQQSEAADLHHAMGLLLVRSSDLPGALAELRKAAELDPDTPRYAYVYAIALNSQQQSEAAIRVLQGAHQRAPADRDILFALATINRDAGNAAAARRWAEAMLQLNPADQEAEYIRQQVLTPQ